MGGKEIGCEASHEPIDMPREQLPVEAHIQAFYAVRRIEMQHRLPVLGNIVEQFTDGVMEKEPIFVVEQRFPESRQHPLEPGTIRIGALSSLDSNEMRRNLKRVDRERAITSLDRLREPPLLGQGVTKGVVEQVAAGIERYRPPQMNLRFAIILLEH